MIMDREMKELAIIGVIVLAMLYVLRPNKNGKGEDDVPTKYPEPKVASGNAKSKKDDAAVAMQAVKDAMANNESSKVMNELIQTLKKEYDVVVKIGKDGKLKAFTSKGELIAEEA